MTPEPNTNMKGSVYVTFISALSTSRLQPTGLEELALWS
jgi:hypothetical protein